MSEQGMQRLIGRVMRITFHNAENGYTVAKVEVPGQPGLLTVVGRMPGVAEGQEITVEGRQVFHPKFGVQLEASAVETSQPSDLEGVRRYLASGLIKGVGPKRAAAMVEALGGEALEVIMHDPARLASVPGIGPKRAKAITQAVAAHGQLREVMVFLQGHGVPASISLRIWRQYGAGAMGLLRSEPHRLAWDVRGIGFATADRIAAKIGITPDHPTRLQAGLLHSLSQAGEEGHVCLPKAELFAKASHILRVDTELLEPSLQVLLQAQRLTGEPEEPGHPIYLTGLHLLETSAAHDLATLARKPGLLTPQRAAKAVAWVSRQLSVSPSPAQAQALTKVLASGLAVLTGGPGTGKTTLVRAVLAIAQRMGHQVLLAAPTGRAAKRMQEMTDLEAFTIHRLLEYSPKEGHFQRNAQRPLEADLLVVDESSMIDTWLAAHLFQALGPRTRLLLVGDANQLPSVGPGLVLKQVMQSGAGVVAELTEIFRQDQAGLIVINAHRVLSGQMPQLPQAGEGDFFFIEEPDPTRVPDLVRRLVAERLPRRFNLDPVRDIQVLAPMHRGHMGCLHLNTTLRAALNPNAANHGPGLAPGDKVMQQRNNYDLDAFNGDLGLVVSADDEGCQVALGERMVTYSLPEQDDLTLAYAVTIHKSQGSEYPAVVIVLGQEHYIMLNRPLLYTALTRGKQAVVIVGQRAALARAVNEAHPTRRHAGLDRKIRKEMWGETLLGPQKGFPPHPPS